MSLKQIAALKENEEMNKFDGMMGFLKIALQPEARLEQVIVLDQHFLLLTRAWCVAELVQADGLHIRQATKIHSLATRVACMERLLKIDVRECEAFPADKEHFKGPKGMASRSRCATAVRSWC